MARRKVFGSVRQTALGGAALLVMAVASGTAAAQDAAGAAQTPEQAAAAHDAYLKKVLQGSLTPKPDYLPGPPDMPIPKHVCPADKARLLANAQEGVDIALQNLGMARLYARDAVASGVLRADEAAREVSGWQNAVDAGRALIASLERLPLSPDCAPGEPQRQRFGQVPATGTPAPPPPNRPVPPSQKELFSAIDDAQGIAQDLMEAARKCDRAAVANHLRELHTLKESTAREVAQNYDDPTGAFAELADGRVAQIVEAGEYAANRYLADSCPTEEQQQPQQVGQVSDGPVPTPPTESELLAAANDARDLGNAVLEARKKCDRAAIAENMRYLLTLKEFAAKGSGHWADDIAKIYDELERSNGPYLAKYCRPEQPRQPPQPPVGQTPEPAKQVSSSSSPSSLPPPLGVVLGGDWAIIANIFVDGGRNEAPPMTAGVVRNDADEELPAGTCSGKLDAFGFGAGLRFPVGGMHAFAEGSYSGTNGKTCPFAVEPGSAEAAGFSFGQETEGSTGLILGNFAGEQGSIRTDLDDYSVVAGIEIPLVGQAAATSGEMPAVHVSLAPFLQYERRNTHYDSRVAITSDLPGFDPDITQNRLQNVGEDHFVVGGRLEIALPITDRVIADFHGSAGVDFVHSSLHSFEHDRCDVCGVALEDVGIETRDSANATRFRGGLEAALEILLTDGVALTVGGKLDVVPTRGARNPVTGDDVLDGKITGLGDIDNALGRYIFAGVTLDF
jgi:hypothetical protein